MTALAGELPVRELWTTYYRIPNQDEAILDAMLSLPKNYGLFFEEWINIGSAIKDVFGDRSQKFFEGWSAQSDKNKPAFTTECWRSFKPTGRGATTIYQLAKDNGWRPDSYTRLKPEKLRQSHGAEQAAKIIDLFEVKSAPEAPEGAPRAVGIGYDAELVLSPGGILQELSEWITATSKRKQPLLALGGATALVGLLCAHGYRIVHNGHDTRSNTIIVGLAASGSGKDHPRRCIKAILAELEMVDFVGEDLSSGQALEGAFVGRFANLFLVDEYGHRIAAALNPKGNPHEKKIVEVITKLSTSAAGPYVHTRMAINRHEPVPITHDPCLVAFCTTVEEPLWACMRSGHVNDGSVARHLFLKTETDYPDNDYGAPHFEERLPEMVAHARRVLAGPGGDLEVYRRLGALQATYRDDGRGGSERVAEKPSLLTLPVDPEAKAELCRLDEEELALLREHKPRGTNALVGRLVEHTTRLALICAVSDNPAAPVLAARHVLWGEAVTKCSLSTVLRAAAEHVADTEHHANRNKLLRDLRRVSGGGWITRRDAARGSQWIDARSRAALLAELIELGLVESRTSSRGGQPVSELRCA